MNYELAKELKEAGFECANSKFYNAEIGLAPDPTLSELIDACGEQLFSMERAEAYAVDGIMVGDGTGWIAYPVPLNITTGVFGSTPEEAVKNLWLALNKPNATR